MRLEFDTNSPEETQRFARALGELVEGSDLLALCGDLGSGKTTFAKGLLRGLGFDDIAAVSSPTYVLEHVYLAVRPVHHYDVYRLSSAEEFADLGFEEKLRHGRIVLIEWADKVEDVLPEDRLTVELSVPQDAPVLSSIDGELRVHSRRHLAVTGPRDRWEERLTALARWTP